MIGMIFNHIVLDAAPVRQTFRTRFDVDVRHGVASLMYSDRQPMGRRTTRMLLVRAHVPPVTAPGGPRAIPALVDRTAFDRAREHHSTPQGHRCPIGAITASLTQLLKIAELVNHLGNFLRQRMVLLMWEENMQRKHAGVGTAYAPAAVDYTEAVPSKVAYASAFARSQSFTELLTDVCRASGAPSTQVAAKPYLAR
jgi:hypothetical protein